MGEDVVEAADVGRVLDQCERPVSDELRFGQPSCRNMVVKITLEDPHDVSRGGMVLTIDPFPEPI
jgi:hypothetical protein